MNDQLYTRFIFNNFSLFVNSLLHLVRSYVVIGTYICKSYHTKVKKNKVLCHVVAKKLLGEWSPRELRPSEVENLGD